MCIKEFLLKSSILIIMKKSKLIELLNSIPGNPEIYLWNGMVGDWVDISPTVAPTDLVRMTKEYWLESCQLQDRIERKDWEYVMPDEELARLSKNYASVCKWEINPYVTLKDIEAKRYQFKIVRIIDSKCKGENSFDRLGNISY
jgi:hypothetical protein